MRIIRQCAVLAAFLRRALRLLALREDDAELVRRLKHAEHRALARFLYYS